MREYFRLVKLLKPYRHLLVFSFILIIFFSFFNAASIYLSIPLLKTLFTGVNTDLTVIPNGNFFDSLRHSLDSWIFKEGDKYSALIKVCILLFSAYFFKNFFAFLQGTLTQYVEKSLITDLRRKMFDKFNSLSLRYFNERRSGDIVSRFITDVNAIQNTVSVTFTDLIKQPVLIITFLVMAFLISWKLTLISMVTVPFSVILIIFLGKKLKKYSIRVQESLGDFTSVISENIYGGKIIRAFRMEDFEKKRFDVKLKEYFRSLMKSSVYTALSRPLTELISVGLGVFIIWYAGREIFTGSTLAPEEFIGFLLIIFQLMAPIKDFSTVSNRIQESYASAVRIFEIIDAKPDIEDLPGASDKKEFQHNIEFRNVTFSYASSDKLVLDSINLNVKRNETVAIVGLSGAGKSTLVDLLPRFYDVTSGEILIDGVNIKNIKLGSLRDLFGIVTQEIILFNDTIRSNITYGQKNVPEELVISAAKNANAHEFIMETENGYNTVVGERGLRLSGGQKQRIAIARALLKNAPIMILDEATSSLDTESEHLIQEAIERLMENRTSIVIAHRLSTIKDADRIIVLENGKIGIIGNHTELINDEKGIYKKLYEMQFGN
ncbi:MAG: ABC-type multidrug transport system protein [Chlorobi bacterium OLB5]|nr:MAG: ABC-type multidrug transport system protein [Chlorobi bacterium OLB5]